MSPKIAFDRKSMVIAGARKYIFSGTLQYFRHPSPRQWEHRIKKLKSLGFNTVDTYFYWAYHSPAEGVYDFSGSRDIELFMRMVEDQGMYLIARPGPYMCAEVDGGGFPGWLLAKRHLNLRCRKNGKALYDAGYMKYAEQWYSEVVPRIAQFKNLILFQIENEYNLYPTPRGMIARLMGALQRRYGEDLFMRLISAMIFYRIQIFLQRRAFSSEGYKRELEYFRELYRLARGLGVTVPIFHNDVGGASTRYFPVDLAAIDEYPITDFVGDWKHGNPFLRADTFEEGHDAMKVDCPLFGGEIQGGWYDLWGGRGYEHNGNHLGPLAMDLTLKSCLAQGMSILNIYMAAGGTTWGYTGSPDVYTSYTYGAPITEGGRMSERGEACKRFSEFVFRNEQALLESSPAEEFRQNHGELFAKVRKAPDGTSFVFVRNLTGKDQTVKLQAGEFKIAYPGMEVYRLDKEGKIVDQLPTVQEARAEPMIQLSPKLQITNYRLQVYGAPFKDDDPGWKKIAGKEMDIDTLGVHYGFTWYRAKFRQKISWLRIDARHLWAVYLNGRLLRAYDNFRNKLGVGEDLELKVKVALPPELLKEENALVILTESMGHNKGFLEDSFNPRGLVSAETDQGELDWEFKPGLLPGESGITPKVDFSILLSADESVRSPITLPHKQPVESGLGIYLADFELDLAQPDSPALGIKIGKVSGKANVYINGFLIGRYWDAKGPQKIFYLPPDLANLKGGNELTVVVWPWDTSLGLGAMEIVEYP